ncbi:MAG: hypothetical protein S4CHLAM45_06700 [Chlamydiales bacterium]|nr:hypothetical protein [Chlamydiales bacterium]MCH9620310.1 hypothetical protein [Chlamydiales bacterium]MCH9622779.1 hypothetical protein [Chlamydiales bacterium]
MNDKKTGRNDPCPCGSGKKYKNCCLKKDQAGTKTYTPSGKRKFKAKVIDTGAKTSSLFSQSAAVPTGEGDPNTLKDLRYRMAGKDYRKEEKEEKEAKPIQEPDLDAPKEQTSKEHKPGDTFKPSSENFKVDEK